jgi:hypothetical protein
MTHVLTPLIGGSSPIHDQFVAAMLHRSYRALHQDHLAKSTLVIRRR